MADIVQRRRRLHYLHRFPLDRRIFRDRSNPLEVYDPEEVRERYRFYPETVHFLCGVINLPLKCGRSNPLPPLLTVLVALHFFATNAHHIVTAAVHGVSRASVSRAIGYVTDALVEMADTYIVYPTGAAIRTAQEEFYSIAGFPKVVGVVDCTHIKIQAPSHAEEEYVNRKGFHSLNVQMICDARFRITNVVAKWPGSVHDARIFRDSEISAVIEAGAAQGHILGDSGYPCRLYLMTPYLHTQTRAQERFNNSLCRTRVLIEQTFGILKRRFPCLSYGLRVTPERAVKIVISCAVLHNIGLIRQDINTQHLEDTDMPDNVLYDGKGNGNHFRDYIGNTFFN